MSSDNSASQRRVDEAAQPEIKGVQIRAAYLYLKDRYGEQAVNAALTALGPEDRLLMPSMLLDSNWYSHTAWRAVRRVSRALDPKADKDFAVGMGKYMAEYSFTGVYRSLLGSDPAKLVEKFTWIHDLFYRNVCVLDARNTGKGSALVSYYYNKDVTVTGAACLILMGFWIKTLEMSGAKDVQGSHTKCFAKGADCCQYSLTWTVTP